jgi:general stress protein 26
MKRMNSPAHPLDSPHKKANSEHVIRLAKQLANGSRPGVMATVDSEGNPHVRWMATLSLQEFPHLYALTSPTSRKVEHLRRNPRVSWLFTNDASSAVVNLSGTATIITDQAAVNRIWRMIEDKSNAYFLGLDSVSGGVAVIDTVIEGVECTLPRYDLHYPGDTASS